MAKTVDPGAPENLYPEDAFEGSVTKKDEGAAHPISGQEFATPIKAEYIRAGQFCHSHFSLAKRRRTIHSGSSTNRALSIPMF
jgi:hypothetical protein